MLSSLAVFELPVYAAGETEWEYFLEVQISDATNSKTGNDTFSATFSSI